MTDDSEVTAYSAAKILVRADFFNSQFTETVDILETVMKRIFGGFGKDFDDNAFVLVVVDDDLVANEGQLVLDVLEFFEEGVGFDFFARDEEVGLR